MGRVDKKIAVVTGSGTGIGKAIADRLVEEGAYVAILEYDEALANEACTEIANKYGDADKVKAFKVDMSVEAQVKDAIDNVLKWAGKIDILVNNAAAFVFGQIESVSEADWDKVLSVNIKGYSYSCKHVVPQMKEMKSGSIVNIASMSARIAQPGFVPYNTTKGAVVMMTKCMAMDLGPFNIRANTISPGFIYTRATENHAKTVGKSAKELIDEAVQGGNFFLQRVGDVKEVANAVLFMASDEASYITGTDLLVDGGYCAH